MPPVSALQERHAGGAGAGASPGIDDAGRRAARRPGRQGRSALCRPCGAGVGRRSCGSGYRSQPGANAEPIRDNVLPDLRDLDVQKLYKLLVDDRKQRDIGNKIIRALIADVLKSRLGYIESEPVESGPIGFPYSDTIGLRETINEHGQRVLEVYEKGDASTPDGTSPRLPGWERGIWIRVFWVNKSWAGRSGWSGRFIPRAGPQVKRVINNLMNEVSLTDEERRIAKELGINIGNEDQKLDTDLGIKKNEQESESK